MSDINWKENSIATAFGCQFIIADGNVYDEYGKEFGDGWESGLVDAPYFKLNEIREGDFIPASELDTEQKYNDFFDALKLCGVTGGIVECIGSYSTFKNINTENKVIVIHDVNDQLWAGIVSFPHYLCIREFNFCQIIAIGKLKRMMLERERSKSVGISKPKKSVNVVMTNKTAAIKVLEALGIDASFVQSVSINGKEVFNMENADDITTVTVSKYVKKT